MNEASSAQGTVPAAAATAGQLLREARQAQGMHIAALASAIKVTPRKLELLEADRFDELPDATFTRALAQTVCRTLKMDPAPVLALLPPSRSHRLEKAGPGLNTRMRERPAALQPGDRGGIGKLAVWGPLLLVLAAAAVYFMPARWLPSLSRGAIAPAEADIAASGVGAVFPPTASSPDPGAPAEARAPSDLASPPAGNVGAGTSAATGIAGAVAPSSVALPNAPGSLNSPSAAASAAADARSPGSSALLRIRASADSWIGVVDAQGRSLFGRTLKAGETVDLDGAAPLRVRVGNAAATNLVFRGEAVALERYTRGNLATVELK